MRVSTAGCPHKPRRQSLASRSLARCGALALALSLAGCDLAVLNPQGPIGTNIRTILIDSLAIMLAIVIPTIVAVLAAAWWFRGSNTKARYLPDWEFSGQLELVVWAIPMLTIMLLGGVIWISSHELDPAVPIVSKEEPLDIQVVSLDWKWLFIYPDQHVASVNKLVIPENTPIRFALTSSSVMNAFFIPQLGSMIYTMNGMRTQLNLMADHAGVYRGLSSHFSGDGFPNMHFDAEAKSTGDFYAWLAEVRGGDKALTADAYKELSRQSVVAAPFTFHGVDDGLFEQIVTQKLPPGPGPIAETNPGQAKWLGKGTGD
jgi:cytochrome o ubiquinol oxidase subunit II